MACYGGHTSPIASQTAAQIEGMKMVTDQAKYICDREIFSRKKNMHVGCRRNAHYQIGSRKSVGTTLHYCAAHAPIDAVLIFGENK
jgi:hypothetical protein